MMENIASFLLMHKQKPRRAALWRLVPLAAMLGVPALAFAQTVSGGASPQTMINNVCTFILGPFGETIAVLGIIGIGLAIR